MTISAAAAMIAGSSPNSWMEKGRSISRRNSRSRLFLSPKVRALALIISLTTSEHPYERHSARKALSPTPAIGAKTVCPGIILSAICML